MCELQFGCVESYAGNAALGGLVWAVFTIADYRMAERGELHADLILQSGHQSDSQQRGPA